jgi:hypothetical protein
VDPEKVIGSDEHGESLREASVIALTWGVGGLSAAGRLGGMVDATGQALLAFFDDERPRTGRDDVQIVAPSSNVPEIVGDLPLAVDALRAVKLVRRNRRSFRVHRRQKRYRA